MPRKVETCASYVVQDGHGIGVRRWTIQGGSAKEPLRIGSAVKRPRIDGEPQSLNRKSSFDVGAQYLLDIRLGLVAVPDTLWVDHHDGAMLADVKAAGMVDADAR